MATVLGSYFNHIRTLINGSVRSATKRMTGEKYAVKVIRDRPRARAEVEIHRQVMEHPHVVQLHQVFCNELKFPGESEPSAKLILIMEKMEVDNV